MIENNMLNDRYWRSFECASHNKRRDYWQESLRIAEEKEQGCIKVEPKKGSRFNVRA